MGGEIKVVSELGVGSTFSFELDLKVNQGQSLIMPSRGAIALLSAQNPTESTQIVNNDKSSPARSLSILVAEDVKYNQLLLQKFLQRLGYEPDMAQNGLEVLTKLREKDYDVILMDIHMPELDGIETTKRIVAEWDRDSRPYIIAVTANVTTEDREQYAAIGIDTCISKPINLAQLEKALLRG